VLLEKSIFLHQLESSLHINFNVLLGQIGTMKYVGNSVLLR